MLKRKNVVEDTEITEQLKPFLKEDAVSYSNLVRRLLKEYLKKKLKKANNV